MNAISSSITHNIKRQHDDEHIDIDIKTTNHLKNIMYPEKISTTKCEENTIIIIINTVIKNIFLYKEKQMVSSSTRTGALWEWPPSAPTHA
jgi:hypothetical protein